MAPAPHLRGVEGQRLAGTALERALWDEQFGPPRVGRSRFDFWTFSSGAMVDGGWSWNFLTW